MPREPARTPNSAAANRCSSAASGRSSRRFAGCARRRASDRFCRQVCGTCEACRAAQAEADALDAVYETLTPEDADSLLRRDDGDPRTFALDSKGKAMMRSGLRNLLRNTTQGVKHVAQ